MKYAVQSGRRANFFITENRFIDCYAAKVGGSGVAVYSILQRCANSETRKTWISASRMAEVLAMDRSTVYRKLKELEDLRLIKSIRERDKTTYYVLQVPSPRPEMGSAPLFDGIDPQTVDQDSTWPSVAPERMSCTDTNELYEGDYSVAHMQHGVAQVQHSRRSSENRNKEEQDLENKTTEQDVRGNKSVRHPSPQITESAERITDRFGLPTQLVATVVTAIEYQMEHGGLSVNAATARLGTAMNLAVRKRESPMAQFLADYPARVLAEKTIDRLDLTETVSLVSVVTASIKAEARYTGLSLEDTAMGIMRAAMEDRQAGIPVNKFYFEDTKFRRSANAGRNKGEQRLDRINRAREKAIENIKLRSGS